MTLRPHFLAALGVYLWCLSSVLISQEIEAHDSGDLQARSLQFEGEATFEPFPSVESIRAWSAAFDIGPVKPNSQVEVTLTLNNKANQNLQLLKIKNYGTGKVLEFSEKNLAPSENLRVKVRFKTPNTQKNAKFSEIFEFHNERSELIAFLAINGKLNGNLFLEKAIPTLVVKPGFHEKVISLSISNPITPDSLSVSLGPEPEDMVAEIVPVNEEHCDLKLTFLVDNTFKSTTTKIKVIDHSQGVSDETEFPIQLFSLITVNPKFLTFCDSPQGETHEYQFEARAMLRIYESRSVELRDSKTEDVEEQDADEIPEPTVTAKIGKTGIDTKLTRLSNGIFRVVLTCDETAIEEIKQGKDTFVLIKYHGHVIDYRFKTGLARKG
jgi:hypothetical protein